MDKLHVGQVLLHMNQRLIMGWVIGQVGHVGLLDESRIDYTFE